MSARVIPTHILIVAEDLCFTKKLLHWWEQRESLHAYYAACTLIELRSDLPVEMAPRPAGFQAAIELGAAHWLPSPEPGETADPV